MSKLFVTVFNSVITTQCCNVTIMTNNAMLLDCTYTLNSMAKYSLYLFFPFLLELGLTRETGANYGPLLGKLLEWLILYLVCGYKALCF